MTRLDYRDVVYDKEFNESFNPSQNNSLAIPQAARFFMNEALQNLNNYRPGNVMERCAHALN